MDHAPTELKVAAFVVRAQPGGVLQLLVYVPEEHPTLPPRVPGGGVDPGERPGEAVRREVLEETGLHDLQLIRWLGTQRYFKPYTGKLIERHDYLLRARARTLDAWRWRVRGTGGDAGELLRLWWMGTTELTKLDEEHRGALASYDVTEVFAGLSRQPEAER